MENKPYKRIDVSRPQDQTLETYKAWMTEMAKQLTMGKNEIQWTEEEWIVNWKKFWKEKPGG
jgi:hypothetical protein